MPAAGAAPEIGFATILSPLPEPTAGNVVCTSAGLREDRIHPADVIPAVLEYASKLSDCARATDGGPISKAATARIAAAPWKRRKYER
jgi:hypothetical protein